MRRERVKTVVNHIQADMTPYNILLTEKELEKVSNYLSIDEEDFSDWAGNHIDITKFNNHGEYIKPEYYKDEFGVVWNRTIDKDIGNIEEYLIQGTDINSYKFPEPDEAEIVRLTEELVNNGKDTFKFGEIGFSLFERAWTLNGMENLLCNFLLEPVFAEELLDRILQYNIRIIEIAKNYDIDGFFFGDDYGSQRGMIMGPDTWRKFIKPCLAKMFDIAKGSGKVVALHSCGKISDILSDLVDIGLDIYQTVQPEIYDLKYLKAEYGKDLTFWGGISTQAVLPFVSPKELEYIVKDTIEIMSANGGYIAGPTHDVPRDVPAENIVALVNILKRQLK